MDVQSDLVCAHLPMKIPPLLLNLYLRNTYHGDLYEDMIILGLCGLLGCDPAVWLA